ncbi:MAG: transcriptional repressor [Candidatus Izemoplasma sp.]|nr:transcriptional repressor [Candidatus Izemoplasma sp.]
MQHTFKKLCQAHHISPSITRKSIFNYMHNSQDKHHPTVDDIYKNVKKEIPTLSKTTVYNVLNLFVEHNLVRAIPMATNQKQYELLLDNHSHFICNECHNIYDIPHVKTVLNKDNLHAFQIENEEVVLRGLCPECQSS